MTTGQITQGEWMSRNLSRIQGIISESIRRFEMIRTPQDRDTVEKLVRGVSLELEIAGEFTSITDLKGRYEEQAKAAKRVADILETPVAISSIPELARELENIGKILPSLAQQEVNFGSKSFLDSETAQMTLFQAFQT